MVRVSLGATVVMHPPPGSPGRSGALSPGSTAGRRGLPDTRGCDRHHEDRGGPVGELVVVRHGATEWSRGGQHTGVTDLPLLPDGEEDARRLRPVLAERGLAHAFVSPLVRARRTAELVGLEDGAVDLRVDADLVEVDYGGYEGRTTAEISAGLGRSWSLWTDGTVPGDTPGESLQQVAARADRVLDRVRPL